MCFSEWHLDMDRGSACPWVSFQKLWFSVTHMGSEWPPVVHPASITLMHYALVTMFLEVPCCSISPSDCCASCGWSGPQQGSAPGPLKSVKATQPPPVPGGQFSGDPASRRGLAMQDCRGLWPDKTAQALVPRPAGAQGLALPLPRGCGKRAWREAVGVTASLGSFCWVVFCLSAALSVPCVSLLSSYEGCSGLPPPSLSGSSIPGGQ